MRLSIVNALRRRATSALLLVGFSFMAPAVVDAQDAAVSVVVRPVESVVTTQSLRAPAQVISLNEAVISAQVSATVSEVLVEVGDTVDQGDELVALDRTDYELGVALARAEIETLEAQIRQAEIRLQRAEELMGSNFISSDDLLERQTALQVTRSQLGAARVRLNQAEVQLRRTRIQSPFAAVVAERMVSPGNLVLAGTPLLRVVEANAREVRAEVAFDRIKSLESATAIQFHVGSDTSVPLRIIEVVPIVDATSGNRLVRLGFSGDSALPGTLGDIEWRTASGVIPSRYIVRREDRYGVFIVEEEAARFHPLPNAQEGRPASHTLSPGTLLVVEGQTRLTDGNAVSFDTP